MAGETIRKFPCAQCGADVEYVPDAGLACPFCGHNQGEPQSADQVIEEMDFAAFIARTRSAADAAGAGAPGGVTPATKDVRCTSCSAASTVAADAMSLPCPFCGAPMVVEVKPEGAVLLPEAVLPFKVTKDQVVDRFRKWVAGRWFAPNALKRLARSEAVSGVYRPFYTFDAATQSFYEGQRGEHYYETEHYKDSQGKSQTRQVRKTRWYPASGKVPHFFDDVVAPAGRPLDWNTTYELAGLKPYTPAFLAGWLAERASITPDGAWPAARAIMDKIIDRLVREAIGGDEQRVSFIKSSFNAVRFKHVLLPLYLASYAYGGKTYRFQANGQTGEIHGERPYSAIKIALLVLLCVVVGGTAIYLLAQS